MEKREKISVIIPCYNVEDRVGKCLDSILHQTIQTADLEIICVDDKSDDATVSVLMEYEAKYSEQIMLVLLEKNGKQGNARNVGMTYASGEYIFFVDSDDEIAPETLDVMYAWMKKSPCDYVECEYQTVGTEAERTVNVRGSETVVDSSDPVSRRRYVLQQGWKSHVVGKLYRKDFLQEHQIYFPTDIFMEDVYFSELCMLYANRIVYLPIVYYFYIINYSGTMLSEKIIDYYMDTPKVQNMTTERVLLERLSNGCELEYQMLHFSKAFAEPIERMRRDKRFYNSENIAWLKEKIFFYFPEILQNPYMAQDTSETMSFYKNILVSEQEAWAGIFGM